MIFVHAQDDLNLRILSMFDGMFSLDADATYITINTIFFIVVP